MALTNKASLWVFRVTTPSVVLTPSVMQAGLGATKKLSVIVPGEGAVESRTIKDADLKVLCKQGFGPPVDKQHVFDSLCCCASQPRIALGLTSRVAASLGYSQLTVCSQAGVIDNGIVILSTTRRPQPAPEREKRIARTRVSASRLDSLLPSTKTAVSTPETPSKLASKFV